jgi:hypothetical protein
MHSRSRGATRAARLTALLTLSTVLVGIGGLVHPASASTIVIVDSAAGKQNARLALSSNGDAVAVWDEGNTLEASVKPSGGSWSAPTALTSVDHGTPNAHVVIDSTGFVTVVWTQWNGSGHYSYIATRPAGGPWSSASDLDTGTYGENIAVDIAADGTVTAAWQSPAAAVRIASHSAGSATWTTPVAVGNGYSPALAVGPGGHQALAWSDAATSRTKVRVIAQGGDWSAATTEDASPSGEATYQPKIAFGPGDVLEAVWAQTVTSDPDPATEAVHGASRDALGTWTNYGRALSDPDFTTRPDGIAVDSEGDVTVVWDALDADFTSHLRSLTRHSGTWEATAVTVSDGATNSTARLVVDAADTFTVVYGGSPASTTSRTSTTTWAAPTPLSGTGSVLDDDAQLDGSGHALVVWVRNYSDSTFHSAVEATIFTPAPPVDDTPPTTTVDALPRYTLTGHTTVRWSAADTQSLIAGVALRRRTAAWNGDFSGYTTLLSGTTATSTSVGIAPGRTQCFSARATDTAANVGAWTGDRCTTTPADDRVARKSTGWTRRSGSAYYGGSILAATKRGSMLTARNVHARQISLLVSTGARNGRIAVYWRGVRLGTWSLARSHSSNRQLLTIKTWSAVHTGTLVVKVISAGRPVRIDGFALSAG